MSTHLFSALRDEAPFPRSVGPSDDEDLQISLWTLYELHYQGFTDVDPAMEWEPEALRIRANLERSFETQLRDATSEMLARLDPGRDVAGQLQQLVAEPGPSLASYFHRTATREQGIEFLRMRSLYHLKEADPHAWLVPRLRGRAKAALVEIQYDEYGGGDPKRIHQELFASALAEADLDPTYGAYVDETPGHTLAVNNAMSLFGLHRRLRGASAGHLAAFEMTSSVPCRRYAQGADRLDLGAATVAYFDEHVEADAVHEQVAARDLCGALVEDEPELLGDILLGAASCVLLDARAASSTLECWATGMSALRPTSSGVLGESRVS